MSHACRGTVFLDRDGTINVEKSYLHRIEDFEFIPGSPEAIAQLNRAGMRVIVVTNQAGVARGKYTEADVARLHDHMQAELQRFGARIDAIYYCPYHPEGTVDAYRCTSHDRKPNPGLFEKAIRDLALQDDKRFIVGDRLQDLQAGARVGCTAILVRTGYGADEEKLLGQSDVRVDLVAADLSEAVGWILGSQKP